ncbi:MAG: PEGA domain-containing protein [Deltaproteobacteria bacterium]|nr:PEGA domain-containing protein [Deltaproteobacteria bacterium]
MLCAPALLVAHAALVGLEPQPKVAVLDLATPGFETDKGNALSATLVGILASEVGRLGYVVISSADINAMLSYEKQKDLVGCQDDTSCLAEIGGALGADLMVSGALGKLGDGLNLSLSLVDIKRAEVRKRFQGTAGSEAVLAATVSRGVGVLFERTQDLTGTGTLFIKTDPDGGSVRVDGKAVGTAPVTLDELAAGDHLITAERGELKGELALRLAPQALERVTIALEGAPPVKLKVLSTPPEARVFVDGEEVGTTPLLVSEVRPGKRQVRLKLDEYRTHETTVDLSYAEYEKAGKTPFKLEVTLERPTHLLPLPLGLMVGALADGRRLGEGAAFIAEVFVEPLPRLEAAVGLSLPTAVPLTLRYWPYRGLFEAGVLARIVALGRTAAGGWSLATLGGGLCLGKAFEAPLGAVGLRLEVTVSFDLPSRPYAASIVTFPATLAAFWRL